MKRLLLTIAFAITLFFAPRPAAAQVPTIITFFCIGGTFDINETFSCTVSMGPAYLIYASEIITGYCTNNGAPQAGQNVFAACADIQPIGSATGLVNWGIPFVPGAQGRVTAFAKLTNFPGNPEALQTVDCYGIPSGSVEPILPC